MQQWLAAANAGSYGSVAPGSHTDQASDSSYQAADYSPTDASDNTDWQLAGGTGTPSAQFEQAIASQTATANSTPQSDPTKEQSNAGYTSVNYTNSGKNLLIGTRAGGKLDTPIAWSGNLQNSDQNFLIQLTQPLLAADKSVAVPKGAYLVARVRNANAGGLLQMSATSALLTRNGQTTEQPLPQGAILVLGKGGKPLQAKAQRRGGGGNNLGAVLLSGASHAAELANQAVSQSVFNTGGGYTATTTSRDPNYLAGFGQGAAQAIVQQMQNRHQLAQQPIASQPIYVLNQGTSVQIFVNQSVLLSL
jgi:hypothetical protein